MIKNPEELRDALVSLFPEFEREVSDEDDIGYVEPLSYCAIWQCFSPVAFEYLSKAGSKGVICFSALINDLAAAGGDKENAVSTCLLEHSSQVGIKKLIKPYLSSEAKCELR